jgi:uncharacterized protein YxjI
MPSSDRSDHGTADRTRPAFTVPGQPGGRQPNFVVREARLPIGDDYVIELDPGGRVFVVDGKLLSVRASLTIKDIDGVEAFHIQGTLLGVNNVLTVSRHGAKIATVRKQPPEAGHEQYVVELPGSEYVEVLGSPAQRAYKLAFHDYVVASIVHTWMPIGSGFRVHIMPGQDDGVVLAVVICLDVMSRHEREADH